MTNEIESEIAEMGGLAVPVEPTPPVVEPPVVEPPVVEPAVPAVEPPTSVVEPPVGAVAEPPATVVVEPAPVAPVAPSSEVELLKAQIAQQNAAMAEMRTTMERIAATATARPAEQPVQPTVGPDGKPVPVAPGVLSFVETEEGLDEALKTKDNFNGLLTQVVEKAKESILNSLPHIVSQLADGIVSQRMAAAEFYSVNKDLAPNKAFVSLVANELAAANPQWSMQDMMGKLGDEVRKRLAMIPASATPTPAVPPQTPPVDAPAFAPPGGARPGGGVPPAADKLAAEIMELLDI